MALMRPSEPGAPGYLLSLVIILRTWNISPALLPRPPEVDLNKTCFVERREGSACLGAVCSPLLLVTGPGGRIWGGGLPGKMKCASNPGLRLLDISG